MAKAIFWGFLPLSVLSLMLSTSNLKRKILLVIMIFLSILILLALYFTFITNANVQPPVSQITPFPTSMPGTVITRPEFNQPSTWWTYIASLVTAGLLIYSLRNFWIKIHPQKTGFSQIAIEAQDALDDLHAGADIKDTVIRCYYQMDRILDKHRGITRKKAMTPREFELTLMNSGLPGAHIRQITRLFEKVRYGDYSFGEAGKNLAVSSLEAIVDHFGERS
jgi:hypothetical protein